MKRLIALLAVIAAMLAFAGSAIAGDLIFGNVRWYTGYPAAGASVQMINRDNGVTLWTSTNSQGAFSLFTNYKPNYGWAVQAFSGGCIQYSSGYVAVFGGGLAGPIRLTLQYQKNVCHVPVATG